MRLSPLFLLGLLVVACEAKPEKQDGAVPAVLGAAALDSLHAVDAAFAAGMNAKDTTAVFRLTRPFSKGRRLIRSWPA
jgi:hypothetical protein